MSTQFREANMRIAERLEERARIASDPREAAFCSAHAARVRKCAGLPPVGALGSATPAVLTVPATAPALPSATPQPSPELQAEEIVRSIFASAELADRPAAPRARAADPTSGLTPELAAILAKATVPDDCLAAPIQKAPRAMTVQEVVAEIIAAGKADGVYGAAPT
ncbi:hypothetical protein ACCD06_15630 [Azospirillum sp. CT11-132]|uniref:hypothetical protein n=1 Tax=Azospirillum sp. CT11-132 TaxID=3396317 RepID=UPI0039A4E17C